MIRIEIHHLAAFEHLPRREAIAAHRAQSLALLCQRLSALLHCDIVESNLARTARGKPYLPNYPQLAFNLSHAREHWVLVSSFSQQDIGVDIEALNRSVKFVATAAHAFHADELALWQANDADKTLWLRIWTVKEAILKAHGMGIDLPLNSLNTRIHAVFDSGQTEHNALGHFAYQSFEISGLMLSVAWRTGQGCGAFIQPRFELVQFDQF